MLQQICEHWLRVTQSGASSQGCDRLPMTKNDAMMTIIWILTLFSTNSPSTNSPSVIIHLMSWCFISFSQNFNQAVIGWSEKRDFLPRVPRNTIDSTEYKTITLVLYGMQLGLIFIHRNWFFLNIIVLNKCNRGNFPFLLCNSKS